MLANTSSLNDFLLFSQLNNNEFQTYIHQQSEIDLIDNEIERLRNLSFNPFLQSSHGKTCLTLNPDLDPDQNYYNQMTTHIEGCDHHDEDTFHCMTKDSNDKGDPKTRNGGMTERRNGGKLPQILKRRMTENPPKS